MKKSFLQSLFVRTAFYILFSGILVFSCLPARYIKPDNNVPGVRFTRLPTGTSNISGFYFLNEKKGFLWTIYGEYYKTTDGALSWTKINQKVFGLVFRNEKTGFGFSQLPDKIVMVKTEDGGETWQPSYELPPHSSWSNISIDEQKRVLFFINKTSVTAQNTKRESSLLYSEDDGINWRTEKYDTLNVSTIDFADKNIGFATGSSNNNRIILKTQDGGKLWKSLDLSSLGISGAYSIRFHQEIGVIDNAWKTNDKGQTWQKMGILTADGDVHFIDSKNGYAFGSGRISKISKKSDMLQTYASVSYTGDGGATWNTNDKISIIPPITQVFFINDALAFGIAFSEDYFKGELIRINITNQ
ncbi:WD40/YVTN/BNR-like repeat-containing protein [Runella salmonicolor]|uniref:Photosynthesis system II assembly factor Ycf48/Hcf136-like domain-containing protein n=1 Tax=Runella salmonicolor TaxID=2950278 RepID=A0ABT1FY99_9BACT|nr:hypothetical protein [Runella salmonicolor]MCP1385668.1 hypothetical protein [Runella salmonicolor]